MEPPRKPNEDKHLTEFYGYVKFLSFPDRKNWFWNLYGSSNEDLRTACFIEYARESDYLTGQVSLIEENLQRLKIGPEAKQIEIVREIHETGLFHDLVIIDDERAEIGALLVQQVQQLSRAIYPLPPHFLIGRALNEKTFFVPSTGKPAKTYSGLALPDPTEAKRADSPSPYIVCPKSFWLARIKGGYQDGYFEVKGYQTSDGKDAKPPLELMTAPNGRRLSQAGCQVVLVSEKELLSNDYGALLRAAFGSSSPLPDNLQGKAYRLRCIIHRGSFLVSILDDYDNFKKASPQGEFLLFAGRSFTDLYKGMRAELPKVTRHGWNAKESKLQQSAKKVAAFCKKALSALSSVRMSCAIDREDYDLLVKLHKKESEDTRRKLLIPFVDHQTAIGQVIQYESCAKELFPNLSESERKSRTHAHKAMTMVHSNADQKPDLGVPGKGVLPKNNLWNTSAIVYEKSPDLKPKRRRTARRKKSWEKRPSID